MNLTVLFVLQKIQKGEFYGYIYILKGVSVEEKLAFMIVYIEHCIICCPHENLICVLCNMTLLFTWLCSLDRLYRALILLFFIHYLKLNSISGKTSTKVLTCFPEDFSLYGAVSCINLNMNIKCLTDKSLKMTLWVFQTKTLEYSSWQVD